ncbi:MAG: RecX family transcriptional regulator [Chloroflexota bacterium]
MAGTITALKIQKRNKERVNVFLDDEFALAVTLMVATTLRKGQHLSDQEIETLKVQDDQDKGYDRALNFLSFRPRSRTEVARYLHGKGYDEATTEAIIERLVVKQYIDDEAFARFWLENREQFKPRGERALRYELRQKGVPDEVINRILTDVDEDELAWAAIESKLPRWEGLAEDALKKKVFGFLSRRGFGYDVVNQVFERIQASE